MQSVFEVLTTLFPESSTLFDFEINGNLTQFVSVAPPCEKNVSKNSLDFLVHSTLGGASVVLPPLLAVWIDRSLPSAGPLVEFQNEWTLTWAGDARYVLVGMLRRDNGFDSFYSAFVRDLETGEWTAPLMDTEYYRRDITIVLMPDGKGHNSDLLFLYRKV